MRGDLTAAEDAIAGRRQELKAVRRERRRLLKLSELADAKTQEAETAKDDAERQKAALDAQIAAAEAEARAAKMQGVSRRREVGVLTAQRAVLAKKEKGAAGGAAALAELCGIQATQERALALDLATIRRNVALQADQISEARAAIEVVAAKATAHELSREGFARTAEESGKLVVLPTPKK